MHTKGPYLRSGNTVYALNEQGTNRISVLVQGGYAKQDGRNSKYTSEAETAATAALFQAAVTSYDKHCGERAVEAAEADLLGQALEALEIIAANSGSSWQADEANDVLALAKGEK